MGTIRALLATCVILGHASAIWGIDCYSYALREYYAVQIFFVISGFYIALVLNEKYLKLSNGIKVFYINRYLRLMPAFWFISLVCISLMVTYPSLIPEATVYSDNFQVPNTLSDWLKMFLIGIANLTGLGIDAATFFKFSGISCKNFILIQQGWTLSLEFLFYLMCPFLLRCSSKLLIIFCAASYSYRLLLASFEMPFYPWQETFIGCEIMFFIMGILSYRIYKNFIIASQYKNMGYAITIVCGGMLLMGAMLLPQLQQISIQTSLILSIYTTFAMPFIFNATRYLHFDRILGELSYLMYLWHITLGHIFVAYLPLWNGFYLVAVSILFSIPVLLFIERPLQYFRHELALQHEANPAPDTSAPCLQQTAASK